MVPTRGWKICTPESTEPFSAVGYFFGRYLVQNLDIPVGIIGWLAYTTHDITAMIQDAVDNDDPYQLMMTTDGAYKDALGAYARHLALLLRARRLGERFRQPDPAAPPVRQDWRGKHAGAGRGSDDLSAIRLFRRGRVRRPLRPWYGCPQ